MMEADLISETSCSLEQRGFQTGVRVSPGGIGKHPTGNVKSKNKKKNVSNSE
jgi:hypothetical protein